jgi:hypothetical protein
VKQLVEIANFIRRWRTVMKFGKLSRAPLRLLRFAFEDSAAECDWLVRPTDAWAETLPRHVREQDASMQALYDAIAIRRFLFACLPDVPAAEMRAFRQSAREPPQIVIVGTVSRQEPEVAKVTSPVMRAKLYGFHFWLDDGVLVALRSDDRVVSNF